MRPTLLNWLTVGAINICPKDVGSAMNQLVFSKLIRSLQRKSSNWIEQRLHEVRNGGFDVWSSSISTTIAMVVYMQFGRWGFRFFKSGEGQARFYCWIILLRAIEAPTWMISNKIGASADCPSWYATNRINNPLVDSSRTRVESSKNQFSSNKVIFLRK